MNEETRIIQHDADYFLITIFKILIKTLQLVIKASITLLLFGITFMDPV